MLNILPKVSSLPILLAVNLMKMEIEIFQTVTWTMLITWSKGHVWEPLTISQHLVYCGVDTSSASGDMYFICHVNHKSHAGELSCVFVGESSSQHVTTLKTLVTIGILIVKRKNVSSKKWTLSIRIANKKLSWLNSH